MSWAEGTRIFRYEVPVDDQWHMHHCFTPLFVGARRLDVVEFWAVEWPGAKRQFRVIGTGHATPEEGMEYRGTVIAPGGLLVWHLMERHPGHRGE